MKGVRKRQIRLIVESLRLRVEGKSASVIYVRPWSLLGMYVAESVCVSVSVCDGI